MPSPGSPIGPGKPGGPNSPWRHKRDESVSQSNTSLKSGDWIHGNNNLSILSIWLVFYSVLAGEQNSSFHSKLRCTALPSALSHSLLPPHKSPADKWELRASLNTSISLLCVVDGVVVWIPFMGWYIYSPPYRLWFQSPAVLLVPSAPPDPGPPVKQKRRHQPSVSEVLASLSLPFGCLYCIACIVSSSVGFRKQPLFLWLVLIQCTPSVSPNCCLFTVAQYVSWSVAQD